MTLAGAPAAGRAPWAARAAGAAWLASAAVGLSAGAGQDAPPQPPFETFVAGLRADALSRGISPATIEAAFGSLEPLAVVIARDRAQPELTQSLDAYVATRLSARTVATAVEMRRTHGALLARVQEAYGLPPAVMIAIWGLESNFGRFTGSYPTIAALATLAWDGRRPLFRDELFEALSIVDRGLATAEHLKGSWAGAMGQPQFMPSAFVRHAVDFDGDHRIDIWASVPDVFGSMANYLRAAGWRPGERWGRDVRVRPEVLSTIEREVPMRQQGCRAVRELTVRRPLADWRRLGVTRLDGSPLPEAEMSASLVRGRARFFLAYANFEALLAYNCSNAYAVSVGLLADRIGG